MPELPPVQTTSSSFVSKAGTRRRASETSRGRPGSDATLGESLTGGTALCDHLPFMEDSRCDCHGPESRSRSRFPCILDCLGGRSSPASETLSRPPNPRTCPQSKARPLTTASEKTGKSYLAATFPKPSDGLEPSTPPYHAPRSATGRNPWQRFWLVRAVFGAIPFATGCHRLRPLCSINVPCLGVHEGNTRPGFRQTPTLSLFREGVIRNRAIGRWCDAVMKIELEPRHT
jgi:hypothetical protein